MSSDKQAKDTFVLYETDERVSLITLDRADKLDAINTAVKEQLIAAFAQADADAATSVIVIRANGRSFSAGFDIGHSPDRGKGGGAADPNVWDATLHRSLDFGLAPWSARKPVIASVQGHVLGGACELALMCDLTIAADDARFGEPEVRFSHVGPMMAMPWFVGLKRARALFLRRHHRRQDRARLRHDQPGGAGRRAARRDPALRQAARAGLARDAALGQAGDQPRRRDRRHARRDRVGRRRARLALRDADRGWPRVRPAREGGRAQGGARLAARAVSRVSARYSSRPSGPRNGYGPAKSPIGT